MNNIVESFSKEDETIKFMRQKYLASKKRNGKDGMHLNNFGITKIVKKKWVFELWLMILVMQ